MHNRFISAELTKQQKVFAYILLLFYYLFGCFHFQGNCAAYINYKFQTTTQSNEYNFKIYAYFCFNAKSKYYITKQGLKKVDESTRIVVRISYEN